MLKPIPLVEPVTNAALRRVIAVTPDDDWCRELCLTFRRPRPLRGHPPTIDCEWRSWRVSEPANNRLRRIPDDRHVSPAQDGGLVKASSLPVQSLAGVPLMEYPKSWRDRSIKSPL